MSDSTPLHRLAAVEHLRWPAEDARRGALRAGHVPRLLLVASWAPPPTLTDELEDWIRLPADVSDIDARSRHLAHSANELAAIRG